MSGVLDVLRLLARRGTLWNLLVLAVLGVFFGSAALHVQPRVDPGACARLAADERGRLVVVLLVTGGTGALLGWTLGELLLTPQAPLLPGLRHRLRRGLLALGGAIAAAAALAYAATGGAEPWLVLALGAGAFGLAVWACDPLLPRGSGFTAVLAAGALLAWLPRLVEVSSAAPLVAGALALALGLAGIELLLRPGALRQRPELRPVDLGVVYRSDAASVNRTLAGARGQRLRVVLPEGRIEGIGGWTRAAFLENFGMFRGGIAGALAVTTLLWVLATLVATGLVGTVVGFSGGRLLSVFQELLRSPGTNTMVVSVIGTVLAIFWITNSLALRTSAGYPLSRGQRARALWRAALVANVGLHAALAAVFLAMSLLVAWPAGQPWRPPSSDYARLLGISLLITPLLQAARVRFIDGRNRPATSIEVGLVTGVALAALQPVLRLGPDLWRDGLSGVPAGGQALLAVTLFVVLQSLWRRGLIRRFRTCDLI